MFYRHKYAGRLQTLKINDVGQKFAERNKLYICLSMLNLQLPVSSNLKLVCHDYELKLLCCEMPFLKEYILLNN